MLRWFFIVEDYVVQLIVRSRTFQRSVQRIHRTVEDYKHGRDPSDPLREGEATRDPTQSNGFLSHFIDELRNQVRGTKTDSTGNRPKR
ncbi:uncharacterized protein F4807DRAFT_169041 [Annulohypoxylon truncatum]|uniref:uncharacterized protein n=1 Tax=Annulohypoxylon truncatum TaxID=327061 RepID=UPI002007CD56|nr:uncharacterized protein F4807DRAFT_169041 [Annulohypoxylon truncatum]KAI1207883.1 hypothetical protein F4807DRAFT_169041 [Annulohypoxylon truncatum]